MSDIQGCEWRPTWLAKVKEGHIESADLAKIAARPHLRGWRQCRVLRFEAPCSVISSFRSKKQEARSKKQEARSNKQEEEARGRGKNKQIQRPIRGFHASL
jgi:hypothetical protein